MLKFTTLALTMAALALILPACGGNDEVPHEHVGPMTPALPGQMPGQMPGMPIDKEALGKQVREGLQAQIEGLSGGGEMVTEANVEKALSLMSRMANATSEAEKVQLATSAMSGGDGLMMALMTQKFAMLALRAKMGEKYAHMPAAGRLSDEEIAIMEPHLDRFLAITKKGRR